MRWALLLALLACAPLGRAQRQGSPLQACGVETGVSFAVEDMAVQSLSSDHITLKVRLRISTAQALHVSRMTLSSLVLDGELPVFAHPMVEDLSLKAGESKAESLTVDVFFADASSPKRMDEMLHAGQVHLSGRLSADLELPLLRRLLLLNLHPVAVAMLQQDVPMEEGTVPFSVVSAVAAGDVLQRGTEAAGALFGLDTKSLWTDQPSERESAWARSVVRVHTSYRAAPGSPPRTSDRLGFWIAPGLALVPDEAVHPWAYDEAAAAAATTCDGQVDPATVEITLTPLDGSGGGGGGVLSESPGVGGGDFRVERQGVPSTQTAVVSSQPKQIQMRVRSSSQNWATLRLSADRVVSPLPVARSARDEAAPLRVFRLPPSGSLRAPLLLSGSAASTGLLLSRPMPPAAFGSPVLASDGSVVGMVVDEQTVLPVAEIVAEVVTEVVARPAQ